VHCVGATPFVVQMGRSKSPRNRNAVAVTEYSSSSSSATVTTLTAGGDGSFSAARTGDGGGGGLGDVLRTLFLPVGFPDSVSADYLHYQTWDTVQASCSYLRGVLSLQALLEGSGVGNAKASGLAAALQWVLRDGAGMLGGLAFTTVCSTRFDENVKAWRLFADVINNVGLTLDLVAPMYPTQFTNIAATAQVCKSMCGVAAGATKASLTSHFAQQNNMADVQAKEGSQETAVTLLGLLAGSALATYADGSAAYIWSVFMALTVLHCYANYRAVRGLRLPTLNRTRAAMLAEAACAAPRAELPSVAEISADEPLLSAPISGAVEITLGCRWQDAFAGPMAAQAARRAAGVFAQENFVIACPTPGRVLVVLSVDASPKDELLAFFHAFAADRANRGGDSVVDIAASYAKNKAAANKWLAALERRGFEVKRGVLGTGQVRCSWASSAKDE